MARHVVSDFACYVYFSIEESVVSLAFLRKRTSETSWVVELQRVDRRTSYVLARSVQGDHARLALRL